MCICVWRWWCCLPYSCGKGKRKEAIPLYPSSTAATTTTPTKTSIRMEVSSPAAGGEEPERRWQCDSCGAFNNHNTSSRPACEKTRPAFLGTLDKERKRKKDKEKEKEKEKERKEGKNAEGEKEKEDKECGRKEGKMARVPATGEPFKIHWRMRLGRRQLLTQDIEAFMKLIKPKDGTQ